MEMIRRLGKLFRDVQGATAIEYGLILAMVALVMLTGLSLMAGTTVDMWNSIANQLSPA